MSQQDRAEAAWSEAKARLAPSALNDGWYKRLYLAGFRAAEEQSQQRIREAERLLRLSLKSTGRNWTEFFAGAVEFLALAPAPSSGEEKG